MLRLPRKRALSRYPTRARQSARCHHSTQLWKCDSHKTRNNTRLECCTCHAESRWTSPKYRACHTKQLNCRHVLKPIGLSRSVTATWKRQVQLRLKRSKMKNLAVFPVGSAMPLKTMESRRDMLEIQNEHFMRNLLKVSCFIALYSYKIIEDGIPTAKLFGFGLLQNSMVNSFSCHFKAMFKHICGNRMWQTYPIRTGLGRCGEPI